MNLRPTPLALVALLALGACGDDSGATRPASITVAEVAGTAGTGAQASARVTISRSRFDAVELRVAAGTTVVFENTDPFAHTITSTGTSSIEFDSGELGQGDTFEVTFDEPGDYPYFCRIHPTMRAVVVVG